MTSWFSLDNGRRKKNNALHQQVMKELCCRHQRIVTVACLPADPDEGHNSRSRPRTPGPTKQICPVYGASLLHGDFVATAPNQKPGEDISNVWTAEALAA